MTSDVNPAAAPRIRSVDILRGLVMIIMALDHVRDWWGPAGYDPLDLAQTSPALYFTRWITHFCAPVFVFLAGTSAFLYQRNVNATPAELSRFLFTRGLWLVFVEVVIISFFWQFNIGTIGQDPGFWATSYNFVVLQVIWAIGWSMVFLSLLVFLPWQAIAAVAALIIVGHNALDGITVDQVGSWWSLLHQGFYFWADFKPLPLFVGYPLIPWIGVMAAGFVFGRLLILPAEQRDRWLVRLGVGLIVGFLLLRYTNVYGNLHQWTSQERGSLFTFLSFMDVTKYPPSLLYLMITLGPALLIMPWLEKASGQWTNVVTVYGRVPFFYYILHLPLINLTGTAYMLIVYGSSDWIFLGGGQFPADYSQSLLLVYVAWLTTVAVLYLPCRWYMNLKRRNKAWYLSYL